jgi:hypothetical protein
MSRSTWLRALMALSTTLLLVTGFFSVPAMAEDTPPAPVQVDRCGIAQDEFIAPDGGGEYGYEVVNPDYGMLRYEETYSTEGLATISVNLYTQDSYEPLEDYWTLAYTNEPCTGTEAPNKGWAEIGECYTDTGQTEVMMFFENVDDITDRYIDDIRVAVQSTDGFGAPVNPIDRVYDGQVESRRVGEANALLYGEHYAGLRPGNFTAWFRLEGASKPLVTTTFFVPACGDEEPPPPPTSRKARGSLSLARCGRVRVIANTIGYTKTPRVAYRVVKFKAGAPRTARVRYFTVPADTRRVSFTKVRPRVRMVVVLKVKRPSGVWDRLDRVRTRRC